MYGGNRGKVFWKMIGYPGLPAAYGIDMVRYRGKPHPRAADRNRSRTSADGAQPAQAQRGDRRRRASRPGWWRAN
jgi:hypothetical protein